VNISHREYKFLSSAASIISSYPDAFLIILNLDNRNYEHKAI
jgi:hypothetical protein